MSGNGTMTEVFGLAASLITLATIAFVIANGGKTARVITASGNVFVNSIRAATFQRR